MADLSKFERVIRGWLLAIKEVVQALEDLELQIEELEKQIKGMKENE